MTDTNEVKVDDRDITLVVIAFIALACSIGLLVFSLIELSGNAVLAQETHRAACSYRENLREQARASTKYLEQHPNGVPALGISAAQIRQGIGRQQRAVYSLSDLHCA